MILYGIILAFGILIFSVVVGALMPHGMEHDLVHNRISRVAGKYNKEKIHDSDDMSKSFTERVIKPYLDKIASKLRKIAPERTDALLSDDPKLAEQKKQLRQAGLNISVGDFRILQVIIIALSALLFFIIAGAMKMDGLYKLLSPVLGVYASFTAMRFYVGARVSKRKESMSRQLPEVLDMLSISVEAGLGLEQAMVQVVENFEGALIDEIAITNRERIMGRSRREALLLLGDRCDIDEAKSFVRAVVQATDMGISIKNVLRSQAEYMRQTRKNKVEEKAMKVPVKILIPMILFIFPVIFIVLLGPAVVSMMDSGFM